MADLPFLVEREAITNSEELFALIRSHNTSQSLNKWKFTPAQINFLLTNDFCSELLKNGIASCHPDNIATINETTRATGKLFNQAQMIQKLQESDTPTDNIERIDCINESGRYKNNGGRKIEPTNVSRTHQKFLVRYSSQLFFVSKCSVPFCVKGCLTLKKPLLCGSHRTKFIEYSTEEFLEKLKKEERKLAETNEDDSNEQYAENNDIDAENEVLDAESNNSDESDVESDESDVESDESDVESDELDVESDELDVESKNNDNSDEQYAKNEIISAENEVNNDDESIIESIIESDVKSDKNEVIDAEIEVIDAENEVISAENAKQTIINETIYIKNCYCIIA